MNQIYTQMGKKRSVEAQWSMDVLPGPTKMEYITIEQKETEII